MTPLFRQRPFGSSALISAVIVLAFLTTRAPLDAEWLLRDYALDANALPVVYLALSVVLFGVCVFEPMIRRELADGKGTALIITAAGVIAFLAAAFVTAIPQGERLNAYPLSLWIIIIHLVSLCALGAISVTAAPLGDSTRRVRWYAGIVGLLLALALLAVSVISVGKFMNLDRPDEPWFVSAATHFAASGRLSPTFLASAYGDPDPVIPGYYALIGMWVRLTDSSIINLRTVPLLLGLISVMITAWALWRSVGRTPMLIGAAVMLTLSAFVRAAHNVRPDIQLTVYSALILVSLLAFLDRKSAWSILLMGAALWIGLEAVPTAALAFSGLVGVLIISQCRTRPDWRYVMLYALMCGIAVALYGAGHFLPDVSLNLSRYQVFVGYYRMQNLLGFVSPLDWLGGYIARFSLILSPIELSAIIGAFAVLTVRGDRRDRLIGALVSAALISLPVFIRTTYGYMALFAPFVAYAAARAARYQIGMVLIAFVLLPALAAPPLLDMINAIRADSNARVIAEADLLTWQIPDDASVAGDDLFWFTLHADHSFVGWEGIRRYALVNGLTPEAAVNALDIQVIICFETDQECAYVPPDEFAPPVDFVITRGRYLVYFRK